MSLLNKLLSSIKIPTIHKEGYPFIIIFTLVTVIVMAVFKWMFIGYICIILTVWCITFFRDPERATPKEEGLVISPADGVITSIKDAFPPEELEVKEEMQCITVFMNVFNVHVNRSPMEGTIEKIHYTPGLFLNASLDKASENNERQSFVLKAKDTNDNIVFTQIAGLVARRIVKFVDVEDKLQAGERFGLIRFGSCVRVYIPKHYNIKVLPKQKMIAGETVLAINPKVNKQ